MEKLRGMNTPDIVREGLAEMMGTLILCVSLLPICAKQPEISATNIPIGLANELYYRYLLEADRSKMLTLYFLLLILFLIHQ